MNQNLSYRFQMLFPSSYNGDVNCSTDQQSLLLYSCRMKFDQTGAISNSHAVSSICWQLGTGKASQSNTFGKLCHSGPYADCIAAHRTTIQYILALGNFDFCVLIALRKMLGKWVRITFANLWSVRNIDLVMYFLVVLYFAVYSLRNDFHI